MQVENKEVENNGVEVAGVAVTGEEKTIVDMEKPADQMAAIYEKHAKKRQEEISAQTPKQEEEKKEPDDSEPDEVTVKVNGRERKVHKSKIEAAGGIEAYRKNAAASELLNKAAVESKALEVRERALVERERALADKERQAPVKVEHNRPSDKIMELSRQYHTAIYEGEQEKATELLIQIQDERGNTNSVNADTITAQAVAAAKQELLREQQAREAARFEQERAQVLEDIPDRFPDIAEDPELYRLADSKTIDLMQEHPEWSPAKVIETACRQVSEWARKRTSPSEGDKLSAKRAITNIRPATAKAASRPTPKPESKSEYVESLRKQRGLGG